MLKITKPAFLVLMVASTKPKLVRIKYIPGVNFLLIMSGKTDVCLGDDGSMELGELLGEGLSLCEGLPQNGMHLLLFAGLPPRTGSQSNDRFNVAHAIFDFVH